MNRIFHVKIAQGAYIFLVLCTALMVIAFWYQEAIVGMIMALLLIVDIERIIHSTYTLTADGKVVVYYGRFYKGKTISLTDITDVELKRSSGFGGIMPSQYVLIHYENKNFLSLVPVKPEEFINALVKRLGHRIEEE
ncbi:MAG: PH domain-containing protein [Bacteroides sp.]|nr:PH domain-containing protein [Bacteroides sp.]